jgi:hypothetical protein
MNYSTYLSHDVVFHGNSVSYDVVLQGACLRMYHTDHHYFIFDFEWVQFFHRVDLKVCHVTGHAPFSISKPTIKNNFGSQPVFYGNNQFTFQ